MHNKIHIGICDDEKIFIDLTTKLCHKYMKECGYEYELYPFTDGSQLLQKKTELDIIFLDIDMPVMSGFDIADTIHRSVDTDVYIIFLTSHPEYSREGFKVNAFRYLLKPVDEKEFEESLHDAIKLMMDVDYLAVHTKESMHLLKKKEIKYLESLGDGCVFYVGDQIVTSSRSLKYWYSQLGTDYFIQCHRAYLVNLMFVDKYDKHELILGDIKLPVSVRQTKNVQQAMLLFVENHAKKR